jgi:hypothetical protein
MGDFPSVVLKNRWHQLEVEYRNTEFTGYRLAGLIFGRLEVIEVFDQRDARTDEAAEAGVDEDEEDEAEATDLERAEAARRPKPPKAPEPPRPKEPLLIFATEIRNDMRAQNPKLSAAEIGKLIGGRWRKLTPAKQARYVAAAAPPGIEPREGSDGPPEEEVSKFGSEVEILDRHHPDPSSFGQSPTK